MQIKNLSIFLVVSIASILIFLALKPAPLKKIIRTENAPAPIGPYNQAVLQNNILYISGQIAIDPTTGELDTRDITAETRQVMQNLKAILNEASLDFKDVVKTSIFLSDMNNFNAVNREYGSWFDDDLAPARETVEVSRLPKDVNVEISMIAIKP